MANNTEAYCPNCKKYTDHYATDGWRCDECDEYNENVGVNPFDKD